MKHWFLTLFLSVWFGVTGGGTAPIQPLLTEPEFLQSKSEWVDKTFSAMTLDERIGQLFMVAAYSNKDAAHFLELERLVSEYHIGGLIFFQGGPLRQAHMCNKLQAKAKTPMLIGMDAEWGLPMRLDSTIGFPRQMTLGAIHNEELIYQMGREIGRQFKRMGMHINFAPVADVNNNPVNPVINSRSFGEVRENVATKSAAYMRGMQDERILANAKHFPGHGDTDTDSHHALPIIRHSRERLESVELYPFRELIKRGLASTMIAHMYIPALDSTAKQASTLSRPIVHDLLRDEMGFEGLIITDALNMKGVSAQFKPGTVELKALLAGNDILLFAEDVPKAVRLIKEAIASGEITEEEINEHCRRILHAKAWVGLNNYQPIATKNLYRDLNNFTAKAIHNQLLRGSMTMVRNTDQVLPIYAGDERKILAIAIGGKNTDQYREALERYAPVDFETMPAVPNQVQVDELMTKSDGYDVLLLSVHGTNQSPSKNFGLSNAAITMINLLNKNRTVVLTHFGNPYALLKLKAVESLNGLLVAYQDTDETREIAAQALFGGIPVNGTLPVSIGECCPAGTGEELPSVQFARALPEEAGLDSRVLNRIDSIVQKGITERAYPGAQVVVARRGQVVYDKSFGFHTYENVQGVAPSDLYDLASLTKILASTVSLMHLQDAGLFDLDKTLGQYLDYIPRDSPYHKMPLRKVLSHQAGMIPWIPFYSKTMLNKEPNPAIYSDEYSEEFPVRVNEGLYMKQQYSDTLIHRILGTRLRTAAEMKDSEYKYSDLGYFFVREIVRELSGLPLNEYAEKHFYQPMGLQTMGYLPRLRFPLHRITPTEYDTYFRKRLVHGDVHDPGAAMQGGVGGHAGVFANAYDVAAVMQMLIDGGKYNGKQFIEKKTIDEYVSCQFCIDEKDKNRRGAGFDKPVMDDGPGPTCKCVSFDTFGHTGFTGTIAWADPEQELVYVFLSNRVYPTAENNKLAKMNIRTDIQEVIYEAIID